MLTMWIIFFNDMMPRAWEGLQAQQWHNPFGSCELATHWHGSERSPAATRFTSQSAHWQVADVHYM
jgi:hypothetical protein